MNAKALRHGLSRRRLQARMVAGRLVFRLVALLGDPIARLASASPRDDLYARHQELADRGPYVRGRLGLDAVTTHETCLAVLRDPRFGVRSSTGDLAGEDPVTAEIPNPVRDSFLLRDPPDHTRLRRIVAPAFRPKLMRGYADSIVAITQGLIDELEDADEFDLIADFARPLPVAVISNLLGVPEENRERFADIGLVAGVALSGVGSLAMADELAEATVELHALFTRLAAERLAAPGDDVISMLVRAQTAGQLTPDELVSSCNVLLLAGFETTVNLIGNAVHALLARPGMWRRLSEEPQWAEAVVEETLRFDPPVQFTGRIAFEPCVVAGQSVARDRAVLVDLAGANRDPVAFAQPGVFDPDRPDASEHLAFSSGIHACLGAPLARLEGSIGLRMLAARFPGLEAAGAPERQAGNAIRGFTEYPIRTPARAAPPN